MRERDVRSPPPDEAESIAQRASSAASSHVEHQKSSVAEEMRSSAQGLERSASVLEDEGQVTLGNLTRRIAHEMDRASRSLESQSLEGLLGNIERVARERPLLTLGFAAFGGLALSRFLSASSTRDDEDFREAYYAGFEPLEPMTPDELEPAYDTMPSSNPRTSSREGLT